MYPTLQVCDATGFGQVGIARITIGLHIAFEGSQVAQRPLGRPALAYEEHRFLQWANLIIGKGFRKINVISAYF